MVIVFVIASIYNILLISAVFMDIKWQEVYDFIWILGALLGIVGMIFTPYFTLVALVSYAFFMLVQEFIMCHAYGKADCHALSVNSIFLCIIGAELEYMVLQLAISFVLLLLTQLLVKNVGRNLKLKRPVAMLPYIYVGFMVTMLFRVIAVLEI